MPSMTERPPLSIPTVIVTPSTPHFSSSAFGSPAYPEKPGSSSGSSSSNASGSSRPARSQIPRIILSPEMPMSEIGAIDMRRTGSSPGRFGGLLPPLGSDESPAPNPDLLLPYYHRPSASSSKRKSTGLVMSFTIIALFIMILVGPAVPLGMLHDSVSGSASAGGEAHRSVLGWLGAGDDALYTPEEEHVDVDMDVSGRVKSIEIEEVDATHSNVRRQADDERPYYPSYGPGQGRRSLSFAAIARRDEAEGEQEETTTTSDDIIPEAGSSESEISEGVVEAFDAATVPTSNSSDDGTGSDETSTGDDGEATTSDQDDDDTDSSSSDDLVLLDARSWKAASLDEEIARKNADNQKHRKPSSSSSSSRESHPFSLKEITDGIDAEAEEDGLEPYNSAKPRQPSSGWSLQDEISHKQSEVDHFTMTYPPKKRLKLSLRAGGWVSGLLKAF